MAETEKLTFPPEQTDCETGSDTIAGNSNTCRAVVVLLQLVAALVNVKVADPTAIPVTIPELSTVATALFEDVHVPPVVGVNCAVCPIHTWAGAETAGRALTVTG